MASRLSSVLVFLFVFTVSVSLKAQTTQFSPGFSWRAYTGTTAPVCLGEGGTGNLCHYYPTNSFESAYQEFAAWRSPNSNPNNATDFMNFRVAFPLNYNPNRPEPYPVILMLHGAGESGRIWSGNFDYAPSNVLYDNNSRNLLHGGNIHQQAANRNPTHPQAFPGIIIFPQVSYSGSWSSGWQEQPTTNQEFIYEFLQYMVAEYNADINRIYTHGLSNGARGVWDTATKRPDLFAAVLPMSGLPYNSDIAADRLHTTPIRLYQGGNDTNPSPGGAVSMINKLVNLGGNPQYILYPNLGHGVWNTAYGEADFWSWMLSKNKRQIYSYGDRRQLNNGEVLDLCPGATRRLGFSDGFSNYQWIKDGTPIAGATNRDLTITGTGDYTGVYKVTFTRPNGTTGESFTVSITGQGTPIVPELTVAGSLVMPYTRDNNSNIGSIGQTETRLYAPEGYTSYRWYRGGLLQGTTTANNYKITHGGGSGSGGSNSNGQGNQANAGNWTVEVLQPSGCWSAPSNIKTLIYKTTAHTLPTGPSVNQNGGTTGTLLYNGNIGLPQLLAQSATSMLVTWTETVPDEEFFEIWRQNVNTENNWNMVGIVPANSTQFLDTGLNPSTGYAYSVRAMVSNSGRFSRKSATNSDNFTPTFPDEEVPTPPADLTVTNITESSITVSWSPSTDNHQVTSYEVYNGTTLVDTVAAPLTTYTFTGLELGATYILNVRAKDFSGNYSTFPKAVVATTLSLVNGVAYNYFYRNPMPGSNGNRLEVFDFNQTPTNTGTATNFNSVTPIANTIQGTTGQNAANFFLEYTAYLQITVAGNYRFYTNSDDGSRLYINDVLVVNSDFDQGATTRSGVVNDLTPGLHKIRVQFYEVGGDNTLTVAYNRCTTPGCTPNNSYSITNSGGNGTITNNGNGTTTASVIPNNLLWRVGTPTLTNYYSATGNLASTSNWWTNPNGTSGSNPASFAINNAVFNIISSRTLSNAWTVSGTNSYVKVTNGATLTLAETLTGRLSADAGATINLNITPAPTFHQIDSASTVNMNVSGTVPLAVYGNLNLNTNATTKTLPISNTMVTGNLQVSDQVTLYGSTAPNRSTLTVAGDITFHGNSGASPTENQRYALVLEGSTPHTISVNGTDIALVSLDAEGSVSFNFNNSNPQNITVGIPSNSGGLTLRPGSTFNLGQHNLVVNGITGLNGTGEISVSGGNITIDTHSAQTSSLNFESANYTINNLSLTNNGSGQFNLANRAELNNLLTVGTGTTVNMQGDFVLRSTSDAGNGTARIGPLLNGANIAGNITAERYMSGEGRIWRYISSPVKDATVEQLQQSFPITGNFTVASTGEGINSGNPSMFSYNETLTPQYQQFPPIGGSNQEILQTGKGYSAFIREDSLSTTWKVTGVPNQGNITFTLTGNATSNSSLGWNLIGNPYPASIQWTNGNSGGWTGTGLNGVARVRVNSNGNTQVLTSGVGDWADGIIAPGQAFWIQTTTANPALSIQESAKVTTDGAFYRAGAEENKVQVVMRTATLKDATAIRFDAAATASYDLAIDAIKLDNSYFNLSSLTADNKPMALNNTTLNYCEQEVKLRITNANAGSYTLDVTGIASLISRDEVTFKDNFTQTEIIITDALTYPFSITTDAASKADGRFVLRFKKPDVLLNQTLKTEAACEQSSPVVLVNNSQPGVTYQAFHNGGAVSEPFMSTGGTLSVPVIPTLVGIGATEVSVKAGFSGCNSYDLPMTIAIQRDSLALPFVIAEPTKLVASTENATNYQWYLNGTLAPDQTAREWLNPENGKYVVEVFKGTCRKVSDTLAYVVTSTEKPNRLYQLYPNPTSNKFIVTLEEPIDFASMGVLSIIGQAVRVPITKISEYSAEIDLSEVRTGFYLLQANGHRYKVLKE